VLSASLTRPKEHHIFDVLHWVKAAFKKNALDEIKESECANKEAFRYVQTSYLTLRCSSHIHFVDCMSLSSPTSCGSLLYPLANIRSARRYHDTTSSFAALATQSSMLSQSASALFDKDHPSMAGKGTHEMLFKELKPEQLSALRTRLGLKEWEDPRPTPPKENTLQF
jgi:hypothetical protein